jgi:hypothetical protein
MFAYHTFHTVMMGHGAYLPGGDHDIQIIAPSSPSPSFLTNPDYYMLPAYLARMTGLRAIARRIDARDGKRDTRWRGHDLDDPHDVRHSPVWVRLQTRILKEVLRREGFGRDAVTDLFFANYKQIDDAGHDWNMLDPSMSDILEETDRGLRELVRFLNRSVGERRYVLAVTADHGQAPAPIRAHAWPIGMEKLAADITTRFDADHIIQETRPTGLWTSGAAMTRSGTSARELARYLIHYRLEDNVDDDSDIPPQYIDRRREPVLAAAFPAAQLDRVWRCAQRRHRS